MTPDQFLATLPPQLRAYFDQLRVWRPGSTPSPKRLEPFPRLAQLWLGALPEHVGLGTEARIYLVESRHGVPFVHDVEVAWADLAGGLWGLIPQPPPVPVALQAVEEQRDRRAKVAGLMETIKGLGGSAPDDTDVGHG